jgi:TolA-binding protein
MYQADTDLLLTCVLVAISFAGLIATVLTFAICSRIMKGGGRKKKHIEDKAETQMIQEIHQSLSKMASRINALETILIASEERQAENQKLYEFERKIERG